MAYTLPVFFSVASLQKPKWPPSPNFLPISNVSLIGTVLPNTQPFGGFTALGFSRRTVLGDGRGMFANDLYSKRSEGDDTIACAAGAAKHVRVALHGNCKRTSNTKVRCCAQCAVLQDRRARRLPLAAALIA